MKDKRMAGLLAALKREVVEPAEGGQEPPVQQVAETPAAAPKPRAVKKTPAAAAGRGVAVQFWIREEDRQLIRELAAYLSTQGHRATDSLVIRAALRVARADAGLIRAFQQAQALDGRRKNNP